MTEIIPLRAGSSIPTGIDKATLSNIKVYGNNEDQIVISGNKNFANNDSFELYNCVGEKIAVGKLTDSSSVLAGSLTPGVYFVVLRVNNEKKTEKVVVK